MNHRVFIAINLPENIKKKLTDYQLKWPELPCRWTKKENLHITLAFLGYLTDEELLEVCKITKEVALRHEPFFINLNKILYGPPHQSKHGTGQAPNQPPRMIWIEGEGSKDLGKLQKNLENALSSAQALTKADKEQEARPYTSHITMGRLKQWEFRQIEIEERPEVNEDVSFNFEVKSIEIMESQLKRGGPEYLILESCPLKS
jgi:2'-5' RNA ligase